MFESFPHPFDEALDWGWDAYEPFAQDLLARTLTPASLASWVADQSRFLALIHELNGRLSVARQDVKGQPVETGGEQHTALGLDDADAFL